jgi:nucleoside-triphosphatase THEP1
MALLEQLNLQQIPVEGLLSRSIYKNQEPFEYRLVNLKTQEEKVLCQREPQEGFQTFGRFYFDLKTVDWGKTILKETDSQSLLVIDEVGKMELEQNEGWWEALVFLTQNRQQPQLWVMREDFVGLLSQAFPQQAFRIINLDDTKVEVLRLEIEVVLKSKEDLKK